MNENKPKITFSLAPLFPILIGVISGIILGDVLDFVYIFGIIACGIVAYITKHKVITIIITSAIISWVNIAIHKDEKISPTLLNRELTYSGIATSIKSTDNIRSIIVEIDSYSDSTSTNLISATKSVVYIPSLNPLIKKGDRITFLGRLVEITDKRDLPNEFNYAKFQARKGLFTSAFIQPDDIVITSENNNLLYTIQNLREDISHYIASLPLSTECIEFLNTTITGDVSMLTEEHRMRYSSTGLAHILALSGLHVGIITLFLAFILLPIDVFGGRKIRFLFTIILLWIYAIITGFSPSVTRAVLMASIFLTAHILQRHHNPYNSLCFAAIIILIMSPTSIYDVGFQLSFVAVACILFFAQKINPINRKRRFWYSIFAVGCVSTSAMLGTGIISAFYFHNFPIYFLLSNIISAYILPIIIVGGIMATILMAFGIEPTILCAIVEFSYNIIDTSTEFITTLPGAQITNIYFKPWVFIPYFSAIICLTFALHYKRKIWIYLTVILIIFSISVGLLCQPKYCTTEYYIPRNTYYTNIIVRDSTTLYVVTTARGGDIEDAFNSCVSKYQDYMGWRNVDSVIMIPKQFKSKRIYRNGSTLILGNDKYEIIDDNNLNDKTPRPKYALVCRGYKQNIIDIYTTLKPDTILLSHDLNKRRHLRYIDSCISNKIPYKSLRDTCFHRVLIP